MDKMEKMDNINNYPSKSNCKVGKITSKKKLKKSINPSIELREEDFKLSIDEFVAEDPNL
jgi:hypothetical protein